MSTMLHLAGGEARIHALTERFYEKLFEDDLLPALFADPTENHAERLAWFLIENMGGPAHHTRERGGFGVAVAAHTHVRISESSRARWVSLMMEACGELQFSDAFESRYRIYAESVSHQTVNAYDAKR